MLGDNYLDDLRKRIEEFCAPTQGRPERMSRPEFLQSIGISKSDSFDALVKSLERFEGGANSLNPFLRSRLIQFFVKDLPNIDMLDWDLYREQVGKCQNFYRSIKDFYVIPNDRFKQLTAQVSGRFFIYKRPVNPHHESLILRSYARIGIPTASADFLMIVEYQKGTYESKDTGKQIDHDFYVGICTKKDGVLITMTRQLNNGAPKTNFFDTITLDSNAGWVTRGFGQSIETCDGYSPNRLAKSKCAIQRIPDSFTMEQIDALIDHVSADSIDDVIAKHVIGKRSSKTTAKLTDSPVATERQILTNASAGCSHPN